MPDAAARLVCYDSMAPATAAVAAPAAAAPPAAPIPPVAPAATAAAVEAEFGLERPSDRLQEVVSRFDGVFEGWVPRQRIRLANGQLWQVVDDSRGVYNLRDPKVTIRRGALGRFVMDVEGAKLAPTVRRIE